jgi:mRNA interferase YafQ
MLEPILTNTFKKELKLMKRRRMDMVKLKTVMTFIQNEQPLPSERKNHPLHGKQYEGKWECHIEPDWLLVYKINPADKTVTFHRTGTHADLFKR